MAVRTNAADVKAIIATSLTESEVDVYIADANALVNAILGEEGLTDALLTTIEKWVSAHLIAMTKSRQPQYKKIGDGAESYPKLGMNMQTTTYGQTALAFDTSGKLANTGKKRIKIEAVPSFDDSPIL
jgi:uncharacterized protein (DUF1697 family)